jgi:hypothetical protein
LVEEACQKALERIDDHVVALNIEALELSADKAMEAVVYSCLGLCALTAL